ncbi:MAG: APC family permease [Planctomycetota bacterium]
MGSSAAGSSESHQPHLSPADGISIIVGIVVGVSIFKSPPLIFGNVTGPWGLIGAWVLGGVLSLAGALCYAEMATTYHDLGGDYSYLKRAFGGWFAFLFGWSQLAATLTGSIGSLAYVFSDYALRLWGLEPGKPASATLGVGFALASVGVLTVANLIGARVGKTLQNLLTLGKLVGLGAIVLAALVAGGQQPLAPTQEMQGPGFGLAMIFVLYAFGGWNDAAFVAAEVRDGQKNIPRVLILGTGLVLVVYLLVNLAYWYALGFDGVRRSSAPAADVLVAAVRHWGSGDAVARGMERAVILMVMVSSLGAINGLLFTGSRVYASMGYDHRVFAFLRRWDPRLNGPVWSLLASGVTAMLMIVLIGTESGRAVLDSGFRGVGLTPPNWSKFGGGFDTLVAVTSPIFWGFFLLTGLALFVLRKVDPDRPRPFRVPFFPLTPTLFCLASVYMLHESLSYAGELALLGLMPVALGAPLYYLDRRAYADDQPQATRPSPAASKQREAD